ncbi:MAG: response regulator [Anaerolineae bacterium]
MSQKPAPIALIVAADPHMAWAMQQVLLPEGWQAIVAHTGTSALAQAASAAVRIAFVNASLPDMDSHDLVKRLRKLRPEISTVVISDFYCPGEEETQQLLQRTMFYNFIARPFDLAEISALAHRPAIGPYPA